MANIPERPCSVVIKDISYSAAPIVPEEKVARVIGDIYAEGLFGNLLRRSRGELNELCRGARYAGLNDTVAFENAIESTRGVLNVDCSSCSCRVEP